MATVTSRPQAHLLPTKLFVPVPDPDVVDRKRLRERLTEARAVRLVLVSGAAGSGKTTLLADWVRQSDRRAAWISLDPGDDEPATFLGYLIEAVQALAAGAGDRAQALLRSTPPADPHIVASVLINDLAGAADGAASGGGVVVLDDYHVVTDPAVHELVLLVLDRLPSITFVIASRSDPPLPLARMRARGQLTEIRDADLRFNDGEAAAFIARIAARELRPESVAALAVRTEGWAAGLQLAGLALRGARDPDAFVTGFQGTHAFVADFLTDEVLAGIPEAQQQFLIRTSLLDRLTGPLCDAALGRSDSHTLLSELSRANLFLVPLDGERTWFRYHHLFADLLRRRAEQESGNVRRDILVRAAAWCDDNRLADDAIGYAVRAGNTGHAADLVARNGLAALAAGAALKALRWIRMLPDDVVRSSPDHCVIAAWAHTLVERYDAVEPYAARAVAPGRRGREWPYVDDVALHARVLLAGAAATEGAPPDTTVQALTQVLETAAPDNMLLRASAEIVCGKTLCHSGRYDAALPHHDRALMLGVRADSDLLRLAAVTGRGKTLLLVGRVRQAIAAMDAELARQRSLHEILGSQTANLYAMLAVAYLERSELEQAQAALQRAWSVMGANSGAADAWQVMLRFGRARHTPFHSMSPMAYYGLTAHIGLLVHRGELDTATRHLDTVESAIPAPSSPAERTVVDALHVRVWAARGDTTRLQRWLPQRRPVSTGTAWWDDVAVRTLARAALGAGDPGSALALLASTFDSESPRELHLGTADALVLAAAAAAALGRRGDEARFTDAALVLSAPEQRGTCWIDVGARAVPLLEGAITRAAAPADALSFAAAVLASLQQQLGATQNDSVLSERELAILRLIAAGHSNRAIADTLFLAVGTVKKHSHNIYGKLGVSSRTAAVQAGRERGLLA